MTFPEKIWIGPQFNSTGLFVLGQSAYGDYDENLATDDGYIRAYLTSQIRDAAYDRWARAAKQTVEKFWNGVMFTNYVLWTGQKREPGPTSKNYRDAESRLTAILEEYRPKFVWIIGREQSRYSKVTIDAAGIPNEVTSIRASDKAFGVAWENISKSIKFNVASE